MGDILAIAELISEHPDYAWLIMATVFLIVGIAAAFALVARKQFERVIHPRNRSRFLFVFLCAGMICVFCQFLLAPWNIALFALLAVLWVALFAVEAWLLQPVELLTCKNWLLRRHADCFKSGTCKQEASYFEGGRPWYLFSRRDKVEFQIMRCQYYLCDSRYADACAALKEIDPHWLYQQESELIRLQVAMCLLQMGNMHAARSLLDDLGDACRNPMRWFGYSFIAQQAGNTEEAYAAISKARGLADSANVPDKATIYENYACCEIALGNKRAGLDVFQSLEQDIRFRKDNRLVFQTGGNRLLQMAACGASAQECEEAFGQLKQNVLCPNEAANRLRLMEMKLRYLNQLGDDERRYEALRDGYLDLVQDLQGVASEYFKQTVFTSAVNCGYCHDWIDDDIQGDASAYERLEPFDKVSIFKAYSDVFDRADFAPYLALAPFSNLAETIRDYVGSRAMSDVRNLLASRDKSDIYRYKALRLFEIWVIRKTRGFQSLDEAAQLYRELIAFLVNEGLSLEVVDVAIRFARECLSPDAVLVDTPFGWISYADWRRLRLARPCYHCDLEARPRAVHPEHRAVIAADGVLRHEKTPSVSAA